MNAAREGRRPVPYHGMSSSELISVTSCGATKCAGCVELELKINAQAVDALNKLADQRDISRSELIELILLAELERQRPAG